MADIIPDPGVYQGETAQALQAYQSALAAIAQRRAQTLQSYGFTAKVDPTTGQLTNYGIDGSNPYGQLQQLMDQQQGQQSQLSQNNLARGLGTSGLAAGLAQRLHNAQGGQTMGLGQQFMGEISGEANDQVAAQNAYSSARTQAQLDAINAAIQNQQFQQVAATPTPGTAAGVTAAVSGVPTPAQTLAKQLAKNKQAAPSLNTFKAV